MIPILGRYFERRKAAARRAKLADKFDALKSRRAKIVANRAYQAAEITRLARSIPLQRSADKAIGEDYWNLLGRARHLVRNDAFAAGAVTRLARNIVGTGITTSAAAHVGDVPDDEFNDESDQLFDDYCEREIDAAGQNSMAEMQELLIRECIESGEAFLVEVADPDPNRQVPIAFQMLETEQLDRSQDRERDASGVEIVKGIELDRRGQPLAYHFLDAHPYGPHGSGATRSTRIPAADVIHLFRRTRIGQTSGLTWFAPILRMLRDLGWFTENELQSSAIAALFTVAIKRAHGAGSGLGFLDSVDDDTEDDAGNPLTDLGSGIIADIGAEDTVEQIESKRPGSAAEPWIKLILQAISCGLGFSYLALTNDWSSTTWAGGRGTCVDDRQGFRVLQGWFGRTMPMEIRTRWTRQAAAFGLFQSVSAAQVRKAPRRWLRAELDFPGWEWVDPQKEMEASRGAIESNQSTYQRELSVRGLDWRKVFRQRKREKDYAKKLDILPEKPAPKIVSAPPANAPNKPPQPPVDESADETTNEDIMAADEANQ